MVILGILCHSAVQRDHRSKCLPSVFNTFLAIIFICSSVTKVPQWTLLSCSRDIVSVCIYIQQCQCQLAHKHTNNNYLCIQWAFPLLSVRLLTTAFYCSLCYCYGYDTRAQASKYNHSTQITYAYMFLC